MASLVKTDKISTTAGGAQEFTLPAADGTANQHLKTDGSGVLGWASPPTANPLTLTGSTNTWIPTITGADALTGTANFTYDGNTLDVKNSGTASSIKLYCESSNAHYQAIKAAPHSGSSDWTLTLPSTVPSVSGQALTATTAGVASWTTISGAPAPRYFYAWNTIGGALNASTDTLAPLNGIDQSHSAYDASTYTWTATADDAGRWIFIAQGAYYTSTNNGNDYRVYIFKNGSKSSGSYSWSWQTTNYLRHFTTHNQEMINISSGDTIQMYGYTAVASIFFQGDGGGGQKQNSLFGYKL